MDIINQIDVSDREEDDFEEPLAEEDYDPRLYEEQLGRAKLIGRSQRALTVTRVNSTQRCKASKLHADAI